MPRVRRKQRFRFDAIDINLRRDIEHGMPFIGDAGFPAKQDMAGAWEIVRDEVLRQFIQEHPGRRPFAWWLFDHRIERPVVADWADDEFVERRRQESRFGFLNTRIQSGPGMTELQEPEHLYLARHNLLTEDER
jgi:hypothetical protein